MSKYCRNKILLKEEGNNGLCINLFITEDRLNVLNADSIFNLTGE